MCSNNINLQIFTPSTLPADLVHRLLFNGFSIYNGIIIVWGRNYNPKVIEIIDSMSGLEQDFLQIISESNGKLTLYWVDIPDDDFLIGKDIKIGQECYTIELSAIMV